MRRHYESGRDASGRRAAAVTALRSLLTTAALVVVYFSVPVSEAPSVQAGALLGIGLVCFTALITMQVRSITRSNRPRLRAIEVLATVAPLFIVLFAMSYYLLGRQTSGSFSQPLSRLDALYFVVTVFATVGFGDIVALSETARALVTIQMAGDLIVLGLGLRVVIGAVQIGLSRQRKGPERSDSSLGPPMDSSLSVSPTPSEPPRPRTREP